MEGGSWSAWGSRLRCPRILSPGCKLAQQSHGWGADPFQNGALAGHFVRRIGYTHVSAHD
eukprot:9337102-Pyramimonas_sp.AAC.1